MPSIGSDTAMLVLHSNPSRPRRSKDGDDDAINELGSIFRATFVSSSSLLPDSSSRRRKER